MNDSLFFVPYDDTSAIALGILAVAAGAIGLGGIGLWSENTRAQLAVDEDARWSIKDSMVAVGVLAALIAGLVLTVASVSSSSAQHGARSAVLENRVAFFEERGVSVPVAQWENLQFPDTEPMEDAEFGIAQATRDGEVISVRLAWEDGEMVLYRTDGVPLELID